MPGSLTTNPSNSVAKTSSTTAVDNIGAAAPILQGLMEGQGWRDQRGEILERDQQSALAIARLRQAAMDYDAAPTDINHDMLIAVVKEELNIARTEYNYAKSQQQYYAKEAAREAKAQAGRQQSWGEWIMGGVKSFFGSSI